MNKYIAQHYEPPSEAYDMIPPYGYFLVYSVADKAFYYVSHYKHEGKNRVVKYYNWGDGSWIAIIWREIEPISEISKIIGDA